MRHSIPNPRKNRLIGIGSRARLAIPIVLAIMASAEMSGQSVALSLSSGSVTPGSTVALTMSLTSSGGAQPTSLQWTLNYATDVTAIVTVATQKNVQCSSVAGATTCLLFGFDTNPLSNGAVSTSNLTISATSLSSSMPISVSNVVASDAAGNGIPATSTGGTITVIQPTVVTPGGVVCSPSSVNAPGSSLCTVTLTGVAPSGGLAVGLSSNNANATVPVNVAVAAGATTGNFTATVKSITSDQSATISAAANGVSKTTTLTLISPTQLTTVNCVPNTLGTGQSAICTVTLNKAAPSLTMVALSSNTGALTVPGSMNIAANASNGTFTATAGTVNANTTATITAALNAQTAAASVSLVATVTPSGVSCSPSSVNAPGSSACTVTLTGVAPSGGLTVGLSSDNANATVPQNVTVAAGTAAVNFTATVKSINSDQSATITATANSTARSTTLSLLTVRWTISGTISPASVGSGTSVTLSGAGSASATADSSGNYSFSGLLNGSYVVAPSKSGFTFTPANVSVSVSGANVAGVNFAAPQIFGSPTLDTQVWTDQSRASTGVTSPKFSTSQGNELLLALIAADTSSVSRTNKKNGGSTSSSGVKGVSGAGLTWDLVLRTQTQNGTAEIWRAFSTSPVTNVSVTATLSQRVTSSITVMGLVGVDASGKNGSGAIGSVGTGNGSSGAPQASLVTTRNNSLVLGVGVDAKAAVARIPAAGQYLVHQYLASGSATYWVQNQNSPTALSGTSVTLSDLAPTADPYNFSIVEILGQSAAASSQAASGALITYASPAVNPAVQSPEAVAAAPVASVNMSSATTGMGGKACSPGGLVSISGKNFTTGASQSATSYPLPTALAGVQVEVNGRAMPLLFVSATQINFQCPLLPEGSPLEIAVINGKKVKIAPVQETMLASAPDLFTLNGTNQGIVLISSTNEIAMPSVAEALGRPAQTGELLTIYTIGLGETQEMVPLGTPAPTDHPILLKNKITVVIGGVEVEPDLPSLAPGWVGLYQVNVAVPPGVPAGSAVPLFLQVTTPAGAVSKSNVVTLAIDGSIGQ